MTVISFLIMLEPNETYTVNLSMTLRKADSNIANYIVVGDVSQVSVLEMFFHLLNLLFLVYKCGNV